MLLWLFSLIGCSLLIFWILLPAAIFSTPLSQWVPTLLIKFWLKVRPRLLYYAIKFPLLFFRTHLSIFPILKGGHCIFLYYDSHFFKSLFSALLSDFYDDIFELKLLFWAWRWSLDFCLFPTCNFDRPKLFALWVEGTTVIFASNEAQVIAKNLFLLQDRWWRSCFWRANLQFCVITIQVFLFLCCTLLFLHFGLISARFALLF